jgi:hypothetical protein
VVQSAELPLPGNVSQRCLAQLVGVPTICTRTIATTVIAKGGGDRENVTKKGIFNKRTKKKEASRNPHGLIRLRSVLEPQPAHVGLFRVISTKVQFSPLKPQFPTRRDIRKRSMFRRYVRR